VEAAEALKLTPEDLKRYHLIDEIIPEPEGGAQNDPAGMAKCLGSVLERQLRELLNASPDDLIDCRHRKFRAMGALGEYSASSSLDASPLFLRLRYRAHASRAFTSRAAGGNVNCPDQKCWPRTRSRNLAISDGLSRFRSA